jgi:hypothetical protein
MDEIAEHSGTNWLRAKGVIPVSLLSTDRAKAQMISSEYQFVL